MQRVAALAVAIVSLASLPAQDPPKVHLWVAWAETATDVWDELRQVDPAFNALPEEVARLAKGLEADDIEVRSKAAASLMDLGLTAYEPIKALRDKSKSLPVQGELDAVLKTMIANMDPPPTRIPLARRIGEKEVLELKTRLRDKKLIQQNPLLVLRDGTKSTIQVGDAHPTVARRRSFTIEGNGRSVRQDECASLMEIGWLLEIKAKVDGAKGTVRLDMTATTRGRVGIVPSEVIARLAPEIKSKDGFLAGPFPPVNEKGPPSWILVEGLIVP